MKQRLVLVAIVILVVFLLVGCATPKIPSIEEYPYLVWYAGTNNYAKGYEVSNGHLIIYGMKGFGDIFFPPLDYAVYITDRRKSG